MIESIGNVPLFIEASNKEDLVKAIIAHNLREKTAYKFFQIMKDGKKWVGWYYGDANPMLKKDLKTTLEANGGN